MKTDISNIKRVFHIFLYLPFLVPWLLTNKRSLIQRDLARWPKIFMWDSLIADFLYSMRNPVYRAVFFHRIKCGNVSARLIGRMISWFYKPPQSLQIFTREIGPGLFIEHGICTIIAAKRIGSDAWINQGVTIGWKDKNGPPVIGNNVRVGAGAKILGNVVVGDNVQVGANAVVVKDVPPDTTVVGVPARIVRRNGKRVLEDLV